ncbi:hypothetical protein MUN88_10165 [Gracilibacillus caseinilyticus]|uniref:YfzA-like protein n=1 Tax=Gracilibacillus caseinilyticus TaxID=2932256 RepID=A0ABY4F2C4_9BACI|nr:hypothetical protein [Gracilibacillus caseinilyticus]UOQ50386.1 hypothetical protein MUN88_10165 [Gracilibacillus caseinilyticus]
MNKLYSHLIKIIITLLLLFGFHEISEMDLPLISDIPFIGMYIQYLYEILMDILFLIAIFLFIKLAYQSIEDLLFKRN